jgi:hypothetical protein
MRAEGVFTVASFAPAEIQSVTEIETSLPVGVATMEKQYSGAIDGRSTTVFVSAFDQASAVGTYVALESFEGTLEGRHGTFNFAHSASTTGGERINEFFAIVPESGTAELADIRGSGGMAIDADGTHRIWFDYYVN